MFSLTDTDRSFPLKYSNIRQGSHKINLVNLFFEPNGEATLRSVQSRIGIVHFLPIFFSAN